MEVGQNILRGKRQKLPLEISFLFIQQVSHILIVFSSFHLSSCYRVSFLHLSSYFVLLLIPYWLSSMILHASKLRSRDSITYISIRHSVCLSVCLSIFRVRLRPSYAIFSCSPLYATITNYHHLMLLFLFLIYRFLLLFCSFDVFF